MPCCVEGKMCNMHQFMHETKMEAIRAMARPRPKLPWQLRFRCWVDSFAKPVDIWYVVGVVLLIRLILG